MRIRTALSCILASLLAVTRAQAASPMLVDVVRPKALLQLDGIEQSVSFLYGYSGSKTDSSNTSAHQFQERYHFGSGLTILDPSLLQLTVGTELGFDQSLVSKGSSVNSLNYQYQIIASALQYDPYPITVMSSRSTNQVSTAYLPTYTVVTYANQAWLRLRNKKVPLSIHYSRTSTESEGFNQNSSSTNNSFTINATNNYKDRSLTDVTLSYNGSSSEVEGNSEESSRVYSLVGSNTFIFDDAKKYSLGSSLNFAQSKQGTFPQTSASVSENLSAILGKRLQGRAIYQHNYNKTEAVNGTEQVQDTDSVSGTLTHQLFESLVTTASASAQHQSFSAGDETNYGGTAGLNYQKRLPAKSSLRLGATGSRLYTDRKSSVAELTVRDEMHRSVKQGDNITLTTIGNLGSVYRVRSFATDTAGPREYVEGVDYVVNLPLSRIEIRYASAGGTILDGTDLYISYTLLQNPDINYYTDMRALTAGVSLFDNRYVISSEYTVQDQTLLSGRAATVSLYDTTQFRLRADANFVENNFNAEYGNIDSGQTKYSYLSGSWRYMKRFVTSDLSLNMQDQYTKFAATEYSKAASQNDFNVGGTLTRNLTRWARLSLSANYANTTGDNASGNFFFFRGNLMGRVNMLQFSLTGQTGVRLTKGETTRNDSAVFSITRFF